MSKIKDIIAREILDSRGNPTVEVDVYLENGTMGRAAVPSGASTGMREALELRDKDDRYLGKGVLKAVNNVNEIIKPALIGKDALNQREIDTIMIDLDGTENKSKLGANAILGVSMAVLRAAANYKNEPVYKYIGNGKTLPRPMMNIMNGGAHADNNIDFQEFMIIPEANTVHERIRIGAEVFHNLKAILKENGYVTAVGDEGGFAPNLKSTREALDFIMLAIKKAGYTPGKDVNIGLDVAASELYNKETNTYKLDGKDLTNEELMNYYVKLINTYPILSIEDPFFEDDFETLAKFTSLVGNRIMIVGDDYFVTNEKYLEKGIEMHAGNAILLKANQIGTVSEMIKTIVLAKKNNYKTIISHRSGETEDTFIADLAVGLAIPFIKTGSMCRGERIAKYNRLMRIEEKLKRN